MKNILILLTSAALIFVSCSKNKPVKEEVLSAKWEFRKAGDSLWLPATVPGCVHTDLLHNKLIPDPFFGKNEQEVKWIEDSEWDYQSSFTVSDEMAGYSNLELTFDGLDTYADVWMNDSLILNADNMFVGYKVAVNGIARKGENKLKVHFYSAVKIGLEKLRKVPYVLMAANELAPEHERTNVYTRKAPFHYGWDWGPRLVTCGIWKPVKLTAWDNARINDLFITPINISKEKADYKAVLELNGNADNLDFEISVDGKTITSGSPTSPETGKKEISFTIENPELWWTNGLGGHKLYTVEVSMKQAGKILQSVSKRIGVRTLELVQEKDETGYSFKFVLNGVPVFMRGANYIPSDIFLTRNTVENYKRVISDAVEANMNMLRIWGGAVYENDELYDLMDENGLLAWNDFMFACNVQPADSLHLNNIRKEAEYNVKRLRNHPSIALWCGNNENLSAWNGWNWKGRYKPEDEAELWKTYQAIYHKILPDAVKKYNPEVTYWPSSPQTIDSKVADRKSGDEHDWLVWFGNVPFSTYSVNVARFVSEYGLQSFPEMKTIKAFAKDEDLAYRSEIMEHRQRSQMGWIAPGFNGNEMIKSYMQRYYKVPADFESFVYVSQLTQAQGIKYAIETHRRSMPHCMGSLYWQINDCWPTMSWASVDYFGRWKALHYAVKNAFSDVFPIIYRENNDIKVVVANDRLNDSNSHLSLKLYDFSAKVLWEKQIDIQLIANSSLEYFSIPEKELMAFGKPGNSLLEVVVKAENMLSQNLFYFVEGKDLKLDKPGIKMEISKKDENNFELTLTSEKLAKNVALFTNESEGRFSDNFFDIIPGKTYKINFSGKAVNFENDIRIMCLNEAYK